ncbi:MAG: hypothetical protein EON93_06010 [Burkholderiales bacterium]|nr:MAG: hypothetical protein EON93_06010 [Burkholderiales bacterium]
MGWGFLSFALAAALSAWLAVLILIVVWKVVCISRQSFDLMRDTDARTVAFERVQALIFGVLLIGGYTIAGIVELTKAGEPSMPDLPEWPVSMLAGSQTG